MARQTLSNAWNEALAFLSRERRLLIPVAFGTLFLARVLTLVFANVTPGPTSSFVSILMSLWSIVGELAIIALTLHAGLSVKEALQAGARKLPAAILVYLLLGAALFLLSIPIVFGIQQAGVGPDQIVRVLTDQQLLQQLILELPFAVKAYGAVLALAALVIGVRLLLWKQALVGGAGRAIPALRASWRLTGSRFWTLLAVTFLLGLVTLVINWSVTVALGSVFLMIGGAIGSRFTAQVLLVLALAAVTTLVSLVVTVFLTHVYKADSNGM